MAYAGIDIGAVTVKVVVLDGEEIRSSAVEHQGRPTDAIQALRRELGEDTGVAISGTLGRTTEVEAIERALAELRLDVDAVASLGGESFTVYLVSAGRIQSALAHNKCAAGSGAFFVQQIGRLGLSLPEAIARSRAGRRVPLAVRCSVHCKSDITHKLNRQEATAEDVLRTLHEAMADKVTALLERAPSPPRRVLLIGGLSMNEAFVEALRSKVDAEVVVSPRSRHLEAWGDALLARDAGASGWPPLAVKPTFGTLPPLAEGRALVRVVAAGPPAGPLRASPDLLLGIDAGSTTTKAVLLARGALLAAGARDRVTAAIVATDYRRTHGAPVRAARECLRAIEAQVGDVEVSLVAVTGSGRELVGAYLGTEHVINEITAHAEGAAAFDAGVDTIFEIGGQDAKYVLLRHGAPVDYAMNAACAAGTGSFLEESALGDLGLPLEEIAPVALRASHPVHFKATCAAFINSDVRTALQEGRTRDDIVAGLVYAIAQNYLGRVKGHRAVGQKVFLQGGVAMNHAVAAAFASLLGREVVVPPHPELLGCIGVVLRSMDASVRAGSARMLSALVAPELGRRGRFTCGACGMHCSIERFEVAGRRFPFGGRCSLFERARREGHSRGREGEAPDLVEERSRIVFAEPRPEGGREGGLRIGLPRALSTHSLYPLYATFLARLGHQVVLSGVDAQGELRSHSGFCLPVQMAHGAVLDLERKGVETVFVPHVLKMPNGNASKDSYLCPITQGGPYVLARAFPRLRFLAPLLDFSEGYDRSAALVETAVRDLGADPDDAREALDRAVAAQLAAEEALHRLGDEAFRRAVAERRPAVILAGRSYNAYWAQASQSVGKKLASHGIVAIPADCLRPGPGGPTCWHAANTIRSAAALTRAHPNLFVVYVSNFSCTIDALNEAALAAELAPRPYLFLEIDAHTADAGVETRIEAFLDVMERHLAPRTSRGGARRVTRLVEEGMVRTASGRLLSLRDPRVKIFMPTFSRYHSDGWGLAASWLGLHPGGTLDLGRAQLERGLRHTSGRECLPLPIIIGQLLDAHERLRPGEIGGLFMVRGGAPCVLDGFVDYLERFISEKGMDDMFVLDPAEQNGYCGLGLQALQESLDPVLHVADLMVEMEQTLRVVGKPGALDLLRGAWDRFVARSRTARDFEEALPDLVAAAARIPRRADASTCAKVLVTGDFFTRFSPFFMEGVHERYAERGIVLKPSDMAELVLYSVYDGMVAAADRWGLAPSPQALLRACGRVFEADGRSYLTRFLGVWRLSRSERAYRERFLATGLLVAEPNDIARVFESAGPVVSPAIYGETVTTIGKGLDATLAGYDGVLLIGPFNCLPFRVAEGILKPLGLERGLPLVSYESDGCTVPPAFLRQVDVHIRQVLARRDERLAEGGTAASALHSWLHELRAARPEAGPASWLASLRSWRAGP